MSQEGPPAAPPHAAPPPVLLPGALGPARFVQMWTEAAGRPGAVIYGRGPVCPERERGAFSLGPGAGSESLSPRTLSWAQGPIGHIEALLAGWAVWGRRLNTGLTGRGCETGLRAARLHLHLPLHRGREWGASSSSGDPVVLKASPLSAGGDAPGHAPPTPRPSHATSGQGGHGGGGGGTRTQHHCPGWGGTGQPANVPPPSCGVKGRPWVPRTRRLPS